MAENKNERKIKPTRSIPHSLEAEQSLLGCIMYDSDIAADVITKLKEDDFYSESHKYIFSAMQTVNSRNMPVDLVTLTDALENAGTLAAVGGLTYVTEISGSVPSAANYRHYLDIVKRDSVMRSLIRSSAKIAEMAHSDVTGTDAVKFAENEVFSISEGSDTSALTPITGVLSDVMDKIISISDGTDTDKGIPTGFNQLDMLLNGLHRTDLVLIAARPGMGKTSLAMNIVENAALKGYKCAVFSLEMGKQQLVQRMLCSVARVSMQSAIKGTLKGKDWEDLWKANSLLAETSIHIDDSTLITPAEMLSKCRRLKTRYGLDLVMVDYIQLMNGNKSVDSRQQEISEISRTLKILAKEIDVPVLALSQLSRAVENRTNRRPQLSDLRESGAIEQDADIVMFISRQDEKNETEDSTATVASDVAEIIIAKHRNGPQGSVFLGWTGEYTKFENTDRRADDLAKAYGIKDKDGKAKDGDKPKERLTVSAKNVAAEEFPGDDNAPSDAQIEPQTAPDDEELPFDDGVDVTGAPENQES